MSRIRAYSIDTRRPVVSAQINGIVTQIPVDAGQKLQQGDLVAEISSPEAEASLRAAQAELNLAQQDFVLRRLVAGALVFGGERTVGSQSQAICFSFRANVKPAGRPRVFTLRAGQFNLETGCVPTGERGVKQRPHGSELRPIALA